MQDVLLNLANIHLLEYCTQHGIDPSGSHIKKVGPGYYYSLLSDETDDELVSVTFFKSAVPRYSLHDLAVSRGAEIIGSGRCEHRDYDEYFNMCPDCGAHDLLADEEEQEAA